MQNVAAPFLSFCDLRDLETFESKAAPALPCNLHMQNHAYQQSWQDQNLASVSGIIRFARLATDTLGVVLAFS